MRVPSRMSSARASAAEVGIFAAGPDTPTLWPLRRRISSVVPTWVPSRVIIARARASPRARTEARAGRGGLARDRTARCRREETRRRGSPTKHFSKLSVCGEWRAVWFMMRHVFTCISDRFRHPCRVTTRPRPPPPRRRTTPGRAPRMSRRVVSAPPRRLWACSPRRTSWRRATWPCSRRASLCAPPGPAA